MSACVHIRMHLYACMYIRVYVHVCMIMSVCMCLHECVWLLAYVLVCVHMYVHGCVNMYDCMCLYVQVCCMYGCMCWHVYVCVCGAWMCICMCIYMYVCECDGLCARLHACMWVCVWRDAHIYMHVQRVFWCAPECTCVHMCTYCRYERIGHHTYVWWPVISHSAIIIGLTCN